MTVRFNMRSIVHVLAASSAALFSLVPAAARGGFELEKPIPGAGSVLQDGVVYTVSSDMRVQTTGGTSPYCVAEGGTAVIYIQTNVTMTVKGGNASGMRGATPGIEVPSTSTLVVIGGGTLVVNGGAAADGYNGSGAGSPSLSSESSKAGRGGAGGDGGGGGAAAIGGRGGDGGVGGRLPNDTPELQTSWLNNNYDQSGSEGINGLHGTDGGTMGNVYILGSVTVTATTPDDDGSGGACGSTTSGTHDNYAFLGMHYYYVGGGGGGGGGAGGKAAPYGVGGGGAGGGGGGSGGNGGTYWSDLWGTGSSNTPDGAGGQGGQENGESASRPSPVSVGGYSGGEHGFAGACGATGGHGTFYRDIGGTTFNGLSSDGGIGIQTQSHPSIEYKLMFFDEWRHSSTSIVKLAYSMPSAPYHAARDNFTFMGWFTGKNCSGDKYYDADGTRLHAVYDHVGDLKLFAGWRIVDPAAVAVSVQVDGGAATGIVPGVDANGEGWSYDGGAGILALNSPREFTISGTSSNSDVRIVANVDCTVKMDGLSLAASDILRHTPFTVGAGCSVMVKVVGESRLAAKFGAPAISLESNSEVEIDGPCPLFVMGGYSAADIGPAMSADSTKVRIDLAGADLHFEKARFANDNGGACEFVSRASGERVWSVKVPGGFSPGAAVSWEGLDPALTPTNTTADANHAAWIWLPDGPRHFHSVTEGGIIAWVAIVSGAHLTAVRFVPTGILVNGIDAGYFVGPGWYWDKANALWLTNAGPFTVSGSTTNIGLHVAANTEVAVSNLTINLANASPIALESGATLELSLVATNMLVAGDNYAAVSVPAGTRLKVSGDGSLTAKGGYNAAGIGGGRTAADAGGGQQRELGTLEIAGGTVKAVGGYRSAGIGGGVLCKNGTIEISGGVVEATGGTLAPGVGSGDQVSVGTATGDKITISGGILVAKAGRGAAADIGCSDYGVCTSVTVSGGTIRAADGKPPRIGKMRDMPNEPAVIFSGGAIYTVASNAVPAAINDYGFAVFPVDFDVDLPNGKATSASLALNGGSDPRLVGSFQRYGTKDLYANEDGILRLWLPAMPTNASFIAYFVMEDGSSYYFCYSIGEDGKIAQTDFLVVNGEFVSGTADAAGTGWSYKTNTCTVTLAANSWATGVATNGTYRFLVPRGGASSFAISNLLLKAKNASYYSAIVISNDCTLAFGGRTNFVAATGQYSAGIEVAQDVTLTLRGGPAAAAADDGADRREPPLCVYGGPSGAGIGSKGGVTKPGRIVIESGVIFAQGGDKAAGIGGGLSSNLQEDGIVISGGMITAVGGSDAAGIGAGYGKFTLPDRVANISGGTVLATRGIRSLSDLIKSLGNVIVLSPTERTLVITGGSVHGANNLVMPDPVDADGAKLGYVLFTGLEAGKVVDIESEDVPQSYSLEGLRADSSGAICIWLPKESVSRIFKLGGLYFVGGGTTNNVFAAASGSERHPALDSLESLDIKSLSLDGGNVSLVVSALPEGWLERNNSLLRVRAADALPLSASAIKPAEDVSVQVNPDGTITITLPSAGAERMFYRVESK